MSEIFSAQKPTTYEMDGLFNEEDIKNRYFIMGQCLTCKQWNKLDIRNHIYNCSCGSKKYNMREARSIRSWVATKDLKTKR